MSKTPYPRSDRDLLTRISRSAGGRAGYKQLVRELGIGGGRERRLLVEQLTRLVARGELRQMEQGLWAIPRREEPAQKSAAGAGHPRKHSQIDPARSGRDRL